MNDAVVHNLEEEIQYLRSLLDANGIAYDFEAFCKEKEAVTELSQMFPIDISPETAKFFRPIVLCSSGSHRSGRTYCLVDMCVILPLTVTRARMGARPSALAFPFWIMKEMDNPPLRSLVFLASLMIDSVFILTLILFGSQMYHLKIKAL